MEHQSSDWTATTFWRECFLSLLMWFLVDISIMKISFRSLKCCFVCPRQTCWQSTVPTNIANVLDSNYVRLIGKIVNWAKNIFKQENCRKAEQQKNKKSQKAKKNIQLFWTKTMSFWITNPLLKCPIVWMPFKFSESNMRHSVLCLSQILLQNVIATIKHNFELKVVQKN